MNPSHNIVAKSHFPLLVPLFKTRDVVPLCGVQACHCAVKQPREIQSNVTTVGKLSSKMVILWNLVLYSVMQAETVA